MSSFFLKNLTGSDIFLSSLGITIPSGQAVDVLDRQGVTPNAVYLNDDIRARIEDAELAACRFDVATQDFVELTVEEGLGIWDGKGSRPPRYVETYEDLGSIISPSENQPAYVKYLDAQFVYKSGNWEQCGKDTILNEGLISGTLYVNDLVVG